LILVTLKRKREESPEILTEIVKTVREEIARLRPASQIPVSNLSETRMNEIIYSIGLKIVELTDREFQSIGPVPFQPFIWNPEREESQQMRNVETWFRDTLNLPIEFHVKDIHTQKNYQRSFQEVNVVLTGGSDISIGPSGTPCVWIEVKKTKENFNEGQAKGQLFLLDKYYITNSMVVMTDCNDHWIIFFFIKEDNEQYLAICRINSSGVALAIIRQFVLEEGKKICDLSGMTFDYNVNLPPLLQKKTKFTEHITEQIPRADYENRMADLVDNMTEQELFNMAVRKRLIMLRDCCKLDEQPQVDQLIRQFSDDYENPSLMMYS
ncbi:13276_t:CDS:2, partial [Acaulospora morrowiae]